MCPTVGPKSVVSETRAAAAACLASMNVDELTPVQNLELLEFLCDEVLNTNEIRNAMQGECCAAGEASGRNSAPCPTYLNFFL